MSSTRSKKHIISFLMLMSSLCEGFTQNSIEGNRLDSIVEDPRKTELVYVYSQKSYDNLQYPINLDSAEYYILKALDLQYTGKYIIDDRVANTHIYAASLYRNIYQYDKALYHLNKAEEILIEKDPNSLLLGNLYHNKGNIYRVRNDVYRTKEYYEYALDFFSRNGFENTTNFAHVFSNLVKLLTELGEEERVEELLSNYDINALNVSPDIEFSIYITFATNYSKVGKYDQAVEYFKKAYNLISKRKNKNEFNSEFITYYYHIIDFYILYDEYDHALTECDNAFSFIESLDPTATRSRIIYSSNIIYRNSTICYRMDDLEKSLILCDKGIEELNKFFTEIAVGNESNAISNENFSVLPTLYILKSRILFKQYVESNSKVTLQASLSEYDQAISSLDNMKLSMKNENSRFYATSQILEVYNEAIYTGILLFKLSDDMRFLEKAFQFAESGKSFALYSEIKEMEAFEFSDLPNEVKETEENLVGRIQYFEELLYEEQLSSEPDSAQINFYKDRLFHLHDDYDDLKHEIERNNSKYYELKYKMNFVSLEEVQDELPYKEALIEYVLTDTMLITFVVDRKGINVFSQVIGPEFSDECLEYYQLLYKQNFSSGVHQNYRRFVDLGRKFYKILIEPCLEYTDKKSLTIVPDGAIMYLPFEGFLTEDTDTEYINYLDLPYMIRKYSVGYSHSSTMKFAKRLKTRSPQKKVLAFAPEYFDPIQGKNITADNIRQALPDSGVLMPLRGIINEVQSINSIVPSRIFLNEEATEATFKKLAPDYNVLHLAMHTIMRDDEPLYSHLAFTNMEKDSVEDNKLYAYEIYNLKLNAQMAVLSSCSSGFGKMQKGEGMMSLARGFIYAGCPSIIMTLWQVSDQSSSELMTSFYKYLKKGKSKQESMRLAKIDYLDTADDLTSNPYFWSGFVVVGDSSPIYRKSGVAYWMILVTLFIGVIIYIQYRRS